MLQVFASSLATERGMRSVSLAMLKRLSSAQAALPLTGGIRCRACVDAWLLDFLRGISAAPEASAGLAVDLLDFVTQLFRVLGVRGGLWHVVVPSSGVVGGARPVGTSGGRLASAHHWGQ